MSEQIKILVTRPENHADGLIQALQSKGFDSLHFPAMQMVANEAYRPIALQADDHCLFVSKNAIEHAHAALGGLLPEGVRCYTPGQGSAAYFESLFNREALAPEDAAGSAALLEMKEFKQLKNQRFIVFRGVGGRNWIGDQLIARGATVEYAEVYRYLPPESMEALSQSLANEALNAAIFSSAMAMNQCLSAMSEKDRDRLVALPLVVSSSRVLKQAQQHQWRGKIEQAESATDADLANAAARLLSASRESGVGMSKQSKSDASTDDAEKDANNTADNSTDNSQDELDSAIDSLAAKPAAKTDTTATSESPAAEEGSEPDSSADNSGDSSNAGESATDTAAVAATTAAAAASDNAEPPQVIVQKSAGKGIAILALLLALIALGVAGWLYWQSLQTSAAAASQQEGLVAEQQALAQKITSGTDQLTAEMGAFSEQLGQQIGQVANKQQANQARVESIATRQELLDKSLRELRGQLSDDRRAWLEAEVAYLLRFANDRLQLSHDPDTTVRALQAADERIVSLGDPGLFSVREQLRKDIAAVQAVPRPDVSGMALGLSTYLDQLSALPLREVGAHPDQYDRPDVQEAERQIQPWQQALADFWQELKTLVTVREDASPYEVLPTIEDEFLILQNFRLQLEAARVALLQRDTTVFHASLNAAQQWVESYFDTNATPVQALLTDLGNWQQVQLNIERPDISGSYRELQRQMQTRDRDHNSGLGES